MDDEKQQSAAWAQDTDRVLQNLDVETDRGLTDAEAAKRRRRYGRNRMRQMTPKSPLRILINQFKSIVVLILVGAAVVSFAFGQFVDGIAISIAILINTLIGFFMETRAVRSMESLRRMERTTANVLRGGEIRSIPAEAIVPGDIVVLEGGDLVSADMRLFEANKARADESALTGESVPAGKQTEPVEPDADISARKNMLFKGTALTAGSCKGVVTHTGMNTELGKISSLVEEAEDEETPLEKRLEKLGRRLLWITLAILIIVALTGILRGKETFLMIKTATALAVAAIPEGLPIVATIAMARGMLRMARRNALVNRLAAVETLGSTTIICTDKTGTLTENEMTVSRILLDHGQFEVDPANEDSSRRFLLHDNPADPADHPALELLLQAVVLCNNASLAGGDDDAATGDPLERALLEAGIAAGIDRDNLLDEHPEQKEESFDPSVKMMATWNTWAHSNRIMVKGAPEAVLEVCTTIKSGDETADFTDDAKRDWNDRNMDLAARGLRILAVATKTSDSTETDPYSDLTFLGLTAMLDPPRKEVAEAVKRCRDAGIRVIMVTGDHTATAASIARQVGLTDDPEPDAVEGDRIKPPDQLSPDQRDHLAGVRIFSRVSPEQKLNLIDLHRQSGEVVAMTGDGVNDAPALKKADIGVAMGKRGTQVARDAADMVLKDDAFSSIVVAVEQGRIIFGNIRKFVIYLLSGNASEILVVFLASMLNWPLPLLPLQILFLNVINDVFPALALGVGKGNSRIMNDPPRNPEEPVLTARGWAAVFGYGALILVPVMTAFHIAESVLRLENNGPVTVSFLTLAFCRLWHIFNMRDPQTGVISNEVTTNPYVWAALLLCTGLLLAAVYTPGLSGVLSLTPPPAKAWLLIAAFSLFPVTIGQTIKLLHRPRK